MATNASNEFYQWFQSEKDAIQQQLEELQYLSVDQISSKCDVILENLGGLQRKTNLATIYLPSYDQRQFALQTKELLDILNTKRATLLPKARFTFKSKRKLQENITVPSPIISEVEGPIYDHAEGSQAHVSSAPETNSIVPFTVSDQPPINSYAIINKSHTFILPPTEQQGQQEVYIQTLVSCVVDLRLVKTLAAVYISDIRKSIIILPAVNGSIWMDKCEFTLLFAACKQFRMHQTSNARIYLHVVSHPIIEHCKEITFGRYIIDSIDLMKAKLDLDINLYSAVDDFNWLKQQQSPNWSIMSEERQTQAQAILRDIDNGIFDTNESADIILNKYDA